MPDRGEVRGIYCVLIDGPQFTSLSPHAQLAWFLLKLSLGKYGLGIVPSPAAVISEPRTRLSLAQAEGVVAELREADWVRTGGTLCWLVRAITFEPSLDVGNPNHRTGLWKFLDALPNLPLKRDFVGFHPEWMIPSPIPSPMPSPRPRKGANRSATIPSPMPSPIPSPMGSPPPANGVSANELPADGAGAPISGAPSAPAGEEGGVGGVGVSFSRPDTGEKTTTPSSPPTPPPPVGAAEKAVVGTKAVVHNGKVVHPRSVAAIVGHLAEVQQAGRAEHTREQMRHLAAELVFAYWAAKTHHDGARLDPKRERTLVARLKEGADNVSEALYVVNGCLRDRNLQGQNERGQKYDGIETIFRDRAQVERLSVLGGYTPGKAHPMAEKYASASAPPAAP